MNKQGTIVRWDAERGFGFVRSPATEVDVFFHVRDYRGGRTPPTQGLSVSYEEIHVGGKGPRAMSVQPLEAARAQARERARSTARGDDMAAPAARARRGARPPYAATEIRAMLLLVPAYAALLVWAAWTTRLPVPVLLAAPLLSALTFFLYWRDKFAAQRGAWRTPEDLLHLFSLVGGWPGAWLAQRLLRHKSSKSSFRLTYWASVVLHWALLAYWLASAAPAR
jgi:uncharacterized membrane protein YsdA (DUF1294 family)/cold shock CspA family protein